MLSGMYFSIEGKDVRAENNSVIQQVTGFDASDYLVINPKNVKDFEGKSFVLSDMVKDVVGMYSGMMQVDGQLSIYQLSIKDDGTYILLEQSFIPRNPTRYTPNYYFNSSDKFQYTKNIFEIEGNEYEYAYWNLERGVLVEKFGKLHFVTLANHKPSDLIGVNNAPFYITQKGKVDLAKSLVLSQFFEAWMHNLLPDTEPNYERLISHKFDYEKEYSFNEGKRYILDEKIFFDGLELSRSNDVDPIVSEGLDAVITQELVLDIFKDTNGIYQVIETKYSIPNDAKLVPYTDYCQ